MTACCYGSNAVLSHQIFPLCARLHFVCSFFSFFVISWHYVVVKKNSNQDFQTNEIGMYGYCIVIVLAIL